MQTTSPVHLGVTDLVPGGAVIPITVVDVAMEVHFQRRHQAARRRTKAGLIVVRVRPMRTTIRVKSLRSYPIMAVSAVNLSRNL